MKILPSPSSGSSRTKGLRRYDVIAGLSVIIIVALILVLSPVSAPHLVVNLSVPVVVPLQAPSGAASIPSAPSSALARPFPSIPAPAVVMPPPPPHRELGDAPRFPDQTK